LFSVKIVSVFCKNQHFIIFGGNLFDKHPVFECEIYISADLNILNYASAI